MMRLIWCKSVVLLKIDIYGRIALLNETDIHMRGLEWEDRGGWLFMERVPVERVRYSNVFYVGRSGLRLMDSLIGLFEANALRFYKDLDVKVPREIGVFKSRFLSEKRVGVDMSVFEFLPTIYKNIGLVDRGGGYSLPKTIYGECGDVVILRDRRFPLGVAMVSLKQDTEGVGLREYEDGLPIYPYSRLIIDRML